ncbi:ribonuclease H-like domain-containing protein [Tanacetum coccineum]
MEKFKTPPDSPLVTVIDPDDQPIWSSTRTVAPTPTDFLEISNLFQYDENQEEVVMLRTFPFSLTGEAKTWLNELNEGTITSWNEMREAFISRHFSPAKFIRLLNEIQSFHHWVTKLSLTPGSDLKDHPLKNMEDRGGSVTFGGSKGYITGKGKIRVGNLDFDSVSFVKELGHFNLFSISQICDKQHKVLFTKTECLVVSLDFKMPDENQILLKVPRQHNMYSFDMKTPALIKDYACLIAKATSDESKLWHKRLGHINFKNLNKLVKGNLVRGLPSKWVFFLATKDGTLLASSDILDKLKTSLITGLRILGSDNGTEFKNRDMLEFCGNKGIKQEYSNARTPQQNGVAERMNRTLIEAARTMLADSLLPTTFWAEAFVTALHIS